MRCCTPPPCFKVDDVLTRDVAGFQDEVRRRVTQLADEQDLGISVEQCAIQSVPPRQLKDAFASVLKAEVTRSKVLDEAYSYENQVTNKAGADAESHYQPGAVRQGPACERRGRAGATVRGDSARNTSGIPNCSRQQRLTETLSRVLTNAQEKLFVADGPSGNRKQLRLLLNREPPKLKTEAAKP